MRVSARPQYARHPSRQVAGRYARRDHDQTQVMPAVPALSPPAVKEPRADKTEVIPAVPVPEPAVEERTGTQVQPEPDSPVDDEDALAGRHRISGADDAGAETAAFRRRKAGRGGAGRTRDHRLQELAAFERTPNRKPRCRPMTTKPRTPRAAGIGFPVRTMPGRRPPSFRRRKARPRWWRPNPRPPGCQSSQHSRRRPNRRPRCRSRTTKPRRRGSASRSRRRRRGDHPHPATARSLPTRFRPNPTANGCSGCLRSWSVKNHG